MPNYEKKAKNKRRKQEGRERREHADKLRCQERQASERAKYGARGKPAPVTVSRLDSGEIIETTSQAKLRKQGKDSKPASEAKQKPKMVYGIFGDSFGMVPYGSPNALIADPAIRKHLIARRAHTEKRPEEAEQTRQEQLERLQAQVATEREAREHWEQERERKRAERMAELRYRAEVARGLRSD